MSDYENGRFDSHSPEERLTLEAEELMRQGRYRDAVGRYRDLRHYAPTDLWATLGHASALELAGEIGEAERVIDQAGSIHTVNVHLQRFRHLFFVRREDFSRAQMAREAIRSSQPLDEEPGDRLADLYFNQGRYHEARREFERLLREEHIEDHELRASLLARFGACLRQQGELEAGREQLLAALGLEPHNNWTLCELAELERQIGDHEQARRHYLAALEVEPDDQWCRGHLAQLAWDRGEGDTAVALYEEILERRPHATWALVELAQVLTQRDPQRSEALCQQAIELDPDYPWAYAQLGALSRSRGEMAAALDSFKQALDAAPGSTWIMHELADTCRQMGRMAEAFTHLEHARSIDPFEATTYGYMADLLRTESRHSEAMANLRKAVELDPDYTWAWRELAEVAALSERHEEAEACCDEAEERDPADPTNAGLRAFLLRCRGKPDAALPHLERAVRQQPDYLWAWREMIEVLLVKGEPQRAEQEAEASLRQLPDHPQLLTMLAEARRAQGKVDAARAAIERGIEIQPEFAHLWALRAELILPQDPQAALRYARRAVRLAPQSDYRALMAQALMANGRFRQAREEVGALLERPTECPPAVFELAAELALQAGDVAGAEGAIAKGLATHGQDPRLLMRRVALGLARERSGALDELHAVFTLERTVPWGQVALLFARGGDGAGARRAAYRQIETAGENPAEASVAWFQAAEVELMLGEQEQARACARAALAHEDPPPAVRILGAWLEQQAGACAAAGRLLAPLTQDLDAVLETERPETLRQLAAVYDDRGERALADRCWQRLGELPLGLELRVEAARHCMVHDRVETAIALLHDRLDTEAKRPASDAAQTLIRELALAHYQAGAPDQARACLQDHDTHLSPINRMLLAQLFIAEEEAQAALNQLERAREHVDDRARALWQQLEVQALMIAGDLQRAREAASLLHRQAPDDETAAVLLARITLADGSPTEALELCHDRRLPATPEPERLALRAALELECASEQEALALLVRHRALLDDRLALVRLLRTAWPFLDDGSCPPATLEDIPAMPALPRLAERLASALAAAGHHELAAAALLRAAEDGRLPPTRVRQLLRRAAPLLKRSGARGRAWACALRGRGLRATLGCLLP
ncbi:MAG: tetratricopeptide repeat protein [Planctomycetota bacterium]